MDICNILVVFIDIFQKLQLVSHELLVHYQGKVFLVVKVKLLICSSAKNSNPVDALVLKYA